MHILKRMGKSWLIAGVLAFAALACNCSNENKVESLDTPQGTVDAFISRVLEKNNLPEAFELLSQSDQKTIMANPVAYSFITGKEDQMTREYSDLYAQLAPDLLEILPKFIRLNARKGEEMDGHVMVDVEVSFPSDYMSLFILGQQIAQSAISKWGHLDPDSISEEQRNKIIWSIKNDIKKAAEEFNVKSWSTYVYPVKVVREEENWKIDLELAGKRNSFGF